MNNELTQLIVTLSFICHSPAFLLLIIGAFKRKNAPETAKTLFIIAGVYFLIGGGVCGMLLGMLGGL